MEKKLFLKRVVYCNRQLSCRMMRFFERKTLQMSNCCLKYKSTRGCLMNSIRTNTQVCSIGGTEAASDPAFLDVHYTLSNAAQRRHCEFA